MLEHGGNLQLAAQQYGIATSDWLDLSTGINPDPYPLPALPAHLFHRLPAEHTALLQSAAHYYGALTQTVPLILATAGSQAALQALPRSRPPCRVALPRTMYQEHAHAWRRAGHQVCLLERPLASDLPADIDVLVLCNPNNPTGQRYTQAQLLTWHRQLRARGGWLVVDEAFMDPTPEHSVLAHAGQPGLWILRSLGKFFGLAGIRVGFVFGEAQAVQTLAELLGPWAVTGPSAYLAHIALEDQVWQQQARQTLSAAAKRLQQLLTAHGLRPQGGTALFQYVPHAHAHALHTALARQGVWTRYFEQPSALRFGLPGAQDWSRLEAALATLSDSQN